MRPVPFSPLAMVLAMVMGCGAVPEGTEQAALGAPQRDLTLQRAPEVLEVASPLELPPTRPERLVVHRPRRAPRPAPAPLPSPVEPEVAAPAEAAAPAPAMTAAEPVTAAATESPAASNPRELAPGKTVTVIPTSSGPSVAPDPNDEMPSAAGRAILVGRGHGGTCRPRGGVRGIGLAPPSRPRYR